MLKRSLKTLALALSLALVLPAAAMGGFGRWRVLFAFFAQAYALVPGLPGDYLRIAYYRLTLRRCSLHSRVSFGSFFAQREVTLGRSVYIGAYCIIGRCRIGDRTQIASHVEVLSGRRQHARGPGGAIRGSDSGVFEEIEIGADCWIGAAAVVMASVGARSTIGAGAVVVKDIPAGVVATGIPARVMGTAQNEASS